MTSSKVDRDSGPLAVTLSTLLSSPAWILWRSPSSVALVRAVFVGHRILRGTNVTLFAQPARAESGVPRPVYNTSLGPPLMGPRSQSWQWKKEGGRKEGVCVCACVRMCHVYACIVVMCVYACMCVRACACVCVRGCVHACVCVCVRGDVCVCVCVSESYVNSLSQVTISFWMERLGLCFLMITATNTLNSHNLRVRHKAVKHNSSSSEPH